MRNRILTAAILGGVMAASAHLGPITSPKADTTISPGTTVAVKWTVSVQHETIDIAYSQDGSTWTNITTGLRNNSTSYNWAVPANFPASTTTRLRVCQRANNACTNSADHNVSNLNAPKGGAYTAVTANFKVSAPSGVAAKIQSPGTMVRLDAAKRSIEAVFELAHTERVTLKAFDPQGRLLAVLLDGEQAAGPHALSVYTSDLDVSRKMVLRLQAGDVVLHQGIVGGL